MKKYITRISLGAFIGAALGFSYYYFIGCNGSCAIASSPYISTAYGMFAGILVMFPNRTKNEEKTDQ